jgi:hypothetical protein
VVFVAEAPSEVPFRYHWLPEPAEEVMTTLPPVQITVDTEVIAGVAGVAFTVTATGADTGAEHPPLLACTV